MLRNFLTRILFWKINNFFFFTLNRFEPKLNSLDKCRVDTQYYMYQKFAQYFSRPEMRNNIHRPPPPK
jgi:hypothetical protein